MADTIDTAAEITAEWNEKCVRQAQRALEGVGTLDCETCGKPIPTRRREAQPNAPRCAPCQQLVEGRRRA